MHAAQANARPSSAAVVTRNQQLHRRTLIAASAADLQQIFTYRLISVKTGAGPLVGREGSAQPFTADGTVSCDYGNSWVP